MKVLIIRERFKKAVARTKLKHERPIFDVGEIFHPSSLLFTEHRSELYYAFGFSDAPTLAEYTYKYGAKREPNRDDMFMSFREDGLSARPSLAFLVSAIRPAVVKALTLNNLSHVAVDDAEFGGILAQTTDPSNTIDIHFCQWAHRGTDPDAQIQSSVDRQVHAWKGLSLENWIHLKNSLRLYKKTGDPSALAYAKKIDSAINPVNLHDYDDYKNDPDWRRFARNDNQREVLERFCKAIERELEGIAKNVSPTDMKEPTHWGMISVGFGRQAFNRSLNYFDNSGTSARFGAVNAILKHDFRNQYELIQKQILYLTNPDHRNIGEAAISVLANSYTEQLGVNGKHAGAIGGEKAGEARSYQHNIERLFMGVRLPGAGRGRLEDNNRSRGWRASLENNRKKQEQIDEWARNRNVPVCTLRQKHQKEAIRLRKELNDMEKLALATDLAIGLGRIKRMLAEVGTNSPILEQRKTITQDPASPDDADTDA